MDGLRISELARRVGVATSTVRYYERIGLVPGPARSSSGYRIYDSDAATRLLFITRAKRLGLSLDAITELVGIWDGTNCGATQARMAALIADKRTEIAERIRELEHFGDQLADVEQRLHANGTPDECASDLNCCTPDLAETPVVFGQRGVAPVVVACTLTATERPERLAEFADLAQHLSSWSRDATTLRLHFDAAPDVTEQVRNLNRSEQLCCGFLTFDIDELDDGPVWTIRALDAATGPALDEFLPLLVPELETSPR